MKLLKSQKNSIFEIIQDFDFFSPDQFEVIENETITGYDTIVHFKADKDNYFSFDDCKYVNRLYVRYSPGEQQIRDFSSDIIWDQALDYFFNWLIYLQREVLSPNLWEQFKSRISEIKYDNDFKNEKFSFSEYAEISEKIEVLKSSLSAIPLLLDQQNTIIARLDHLNETAKELGKFDWVNLFVGTIISVLIQLNVTHDNANAIWDLIKSVFNEYILLK
ncbi:hypothetical protein [Flavobacterium sp. H4147]|uniref:hypothetical protein n=1 Tax=Flavobacterium sp. H4147 TaxID=3034149 RepID=UPI0023ED50DD|nr:hypothetical protein [Flavobacterium sp. H4147]